MPPKRKRYKSRQDGRDGAPSGPGAEPPAPIELRRSLALFAVLLCAMLVLWRLVLLTPMLALSRGVVELSCSLLPGVGSAELVTANGAGDWIVRASLLFPERDVTRKTALQAPGVRTPRTMLQCFSVCFPIFWALALAARPGKRVWRVLGMGTLVLTVTCQLSLTLFLGYWINQFYVVAASWWGAYLLNLGGNCAIGMIPYAAPLLSIIWLDRGLRSLLFGESRPQIPPGPRS